MEPSSDSSPECFNQEAFVISRRPFVVVAVPVLLAAGLPLGLEGSDPRAESLAAVTPYMSFVGVAPCRLVDTREAGFPAGYGPPALAGGGLRTFDMTEARCGIPTTARAVSMNVTVVFPSLPGYLAVWPGTPAEQPDPLVSSLNYEAGDVVPNAVIVPLLDANSQVTVLSVASTHLVVDVNGYFRDTPATEVLNTPAGGVAATSLQAAINELDGEKANLTGWTASSVLVSGSGGSLTTDGQLLWDESANVLTLSGASLKATGTSGRSRIGVSPNLAWSTSALVTVTRRPHGDVRVTTTGTGNRGVYIPAPLPTWLFGTATRVVGLRVCYSTSSSASYISETDVTSLTDDMAMTWLLSDPTDRFSTTPTCFTATSASPQKPIGAPNVFFWIYFASASDELAFGNIEVLLDEN